MLVTSEASAGLYMCVKRQSGDQQLIVLDFLSLIVNNARVRVRLGERVELPCHASLLTSLTPFSDPEDPENINLHRVWYHDATRVIENRSLDDWREFEARSVDVYVIDKANHSDSGEYKCVVLDATGRTWTLNQLELIVTDDDYSQLSFLLHPKFRVSLRLAAFTTLLAVCGKFIFNFFQYLCDC